MHRVLPIPANDLSNETGCPIFSAPPPEDVEFYHRTWKHPIPEAMLDWDAVKVVRRLARFGFEAYLVGGCVRDILFGRQPKDFDVATSALPSEVRRLFRNCRLIGRRFRLAHLLFKKGKIIEVATFRRSATEEDDVSSKHAAENLFGGPADDAIRRDFTINALMYDVAKKEIHDYVGGLQDIEDGRLATIGDPNRRFLEDPVRIIRAAKFSGRLNLTVDQQMLDAMSRYAPLVIECAPARLVEEILKLLRSGSSCECFNLLLNVGVLKELMPVLARKILENGTSETSWRVLKRMDAKIQDGDHVSEATMINALIYPCCCHVLEEGGDVADNFEAALQELLKGMKFTKRHVLHVRQAFLAQRRLASSPSTRRARRILDRDYAADALDLKELTCECEKDRELHSMWLKAFMDRKRGAGTGRGPSDKTDDGSGLKQNQYSHKRRKPRWKKRKGVSSD
jgi:poly(A) polymerase